MLCVLGDIKPHVGEQLGQLMLIVRDWAAKARKYIPGLFTPIFYHFIN
jgi:hypothetical protein